MHNNSPENPDSEPEHHQEPSTNEEPQATSADGSIEKNDKKEPKSESEKNVLMFVEEADEIVQTDEVDKRSVFVKNVDYASTKDEIIEHFKSCGQIKRVTIIYDKYTQHPRG